MIAKIYFRRPIDLIYFLHLEKLARLAVQLSSHLQHVEIKIEFFDLDEFEDIKKAFMTFGRWLKNKNLRKFDLIFTERIRHQQLYGMTFENILGLRRMPAAWRPTGFPTSRDVNKAMDLLKGF